MRWSVLALAFFATAAAGQAQPVPRGDSLNTYQDTLRLDAPLPYRLRPFVQPGTLAIWAAGTPLDTASYRVDWTRGLVWMRRVPPPVPFLLARYRTWPFALDTAYRQRGVAPSDSGGVPGSLSPIAEAPAEAPPADPFGNSRLQRSGSLTRGVLAGSRRDVTVESGLHLQLEGEVLDGVQLRAVLTDENTPILAEGTTQRLSEFDRVYIEVDARRAAARLGDVDLALRATELGQLTRKVQGASATARVPGGGRWWQGATVQAAGAAPRGQFRVQEFRPLEGVQGPYRLEGGAGEPYVLVIPGSEVVYLDGVRLVRDRSADYTIDYATGEITFTPRRLLTASQRLLVEFQYTSSQFPRTLVASEAEARLGGLVGGAPRALVAAAFIREADGKALRVDLDLSGADSLLLEQTGDAPATRTGAERVPFDPQAPYVQYTVERQGADSIFVPLATAPDALAPIYRVRFSRVAAGTGRYARGSRLANGIAYEFVGGGGDYEPVRLLPKPREQRLLALAGHFRPAAAVEVYGEWAGSYNDLNRFSRRDAADDVGRAYTAGARLHPVAVGIGKLEAHLARQFRGATFVSFDRLRPVDFARTWNLTDAGGSAATSPDAAIREATDEGEVRLAFSPTSSAAVTAGRLARGGIFSARRAALQLDIAEARGPLVQYAASAARSEDALRGVDGLWLRQQGRVEQPVLGRRLRPRVEVEGERRVQQYAARDGADSSGVGSLSFLEVRPGVAWVAEKLEASLAYGVRREGDVLAGRLVHAADARTLSGTLRYQPAPSFQAEGSVGLRNRDFTPRFQARAGQASTQTVALQAGVRWAPLRRALDFDMDYQAQTQRTPQLQEIYVRVGPDLAEAQYVWQDANGNGLPDLDEFVPETTPFEGEYARTYVPSDTLVGVIGVEARFRLGLDPSRFVGADAGGWRRWLARVSTRTTLDVQERSSNPDLAAFYLLDLRQFLDPVYTQNGRIRVGQDVFLFRGAGRYGLDLSASLLRGRNRLAGETEARRLETYRAEGRYRPATALGLRAAVGFERNRAQSARYASRRFDIASAQAEGGATYTPRPTLSVGLAVFAARKRDAAGREAGVVRVPLDARLARSGRWVLAGTAEVARVALRGDASGQAAYELTDGRGPGLSFLWTTSLQYVLSRFLNLSVSYDGRAPEGAPSIHTVRMQVGAVF